MTIRKRFIVRRGLRGWLLGKWMIYDELGLEGPFGYHATIEDAERWIDRMYPNQNFIPQDRQ